MQYRTLHLERVSNTATVPTKGTEYAACYDLYADLELHTIKARTDNNMEYSIEVEFNKFTLQPNHRALIPTGWLMRSTEDVSIDFLPRSGTAWKDGVSVVNTPGVIDHDYSKECFVAVINHSSSPYVIKHGERIAQMRLVPVIPTELVESALPPVSSSRTGGFQSTGK